MRRPCCPSCGWTLELRRLVGGEGLASWVAVCSNPRTVKPCEHPQMQLADGAVALVGAHEAVDAPSEAALLRRTPAAA